LSIYNKLSLSEVMDRYSPARHIHKRATIVRSVEAINRPQKRLSPRSIPVSTPRTVFGKGQKIHTRRKALNQPCIQGTRIPLRQILKNETQPYNQRHHFSPPAHTHTPIARLGPSCKKSEGRVRREDRTLVTNQQLIQTPSTQHTVPFLRR